MATTRKDLRGRTLRKGEMQRSSDKRYAYSYKDPLGRRKYIYANDLVTLREKETQLTKDQLDGLDIYVAGKATVNFVFDRYMSDDGLFYPAQAVVENGKIKVWSDKVKEPETVRYGWQPFTRANLVNGAGLPASTFRAE